MKKCILLIMGLAIVGCSQQTDTFNYKTKEIKADYSNLETPKERWVAYNLSDYAIEQVWTDESSLGDISSFILAGEIADVDFGTIEETAKGDEYLHKYGKLRYEEAKRKAITIDEAFEMLESYRQKEDYRVEAAYNSRFGYPTSIRIDRIQNSSEVQIADTGIRVAFKNLKKIVR